MRWLYLSTLLLFLGWNGVTLAAEEDSIFNGPTDIPDKGSVEISLGHFTIDKIKSIQLEVEIKHTYIGDLVVLLKTPKGEVVELHDRSGGGKDDLSLYVTSVDALKGMVGDSAAGEWKLEVLDKASYDVGTIVSTYMIVEGEKPSVSEPTEPVEPTEPTTPTEPVDGSCETAWATIQQRHALTGEYRSLIGLCGDALRSKLKEVLSGNRDLGYRGARYLMFTEVDNFNGIVCSVYDDSCLETDDIPKSTVMNCEHTWPQSKGATGIAKSDLHHLYPTESRKNSTRSNWPFCNVERTISSGEGSSLGFSEFGSKCFEPPQYHKGNVARSMFYFAVRYSKSIDREQEHFFRMWAEQDTVDSAEVDRNSAIEGFQGNRNAFVDIPELMYLILDF